MRSAGALLPARFLLLVSHFVLVVTILWERRPHVLAALPEVSSNREFDDKDTEFIVALSFTMVFFAVEVFGFLAGASMFNSTAALLSIFAHAAATVALSFFVVDAYSSNDYWYIFGFCSAAPGLHELLVLFLVYVRKVN